MFELEAGEDPLPDGRVRRPGGGRRAAEDLDPDLVPALLALVEPDERGDPMSPLRWTTKSLRNLAEELTRQGYPVSAPTVGRLLREQGFSLQANTKTLEGKQHPDRDAQFRYVNEQVKAHQVAGQPVISVDAKKVFKPNPQAYTLIEDKLGISPRDVLFISSNHWDACGAKAFGLNVAWIERVMPDSMALLCVENETVAPLTMFKALRTQMDELGVLPDHRIRSLSDLPKVVASYEP